MLTDRILEGLASGETQMLVHKTKPERAVKILREGFKPRPLATKEFNTPCVREDELVIQEAIPEALGIVYAAPTPGVDLWGNIAIEIQGLWLSLGKYTQASRYMVDEEYGHISTLEDPMFDEGILLCRDGRDIRIVRVINYGREDELLSIVCAEVGIPFHQA